MQQHPVYLYICDMTKCANVFLLMLFSLTFSSLLGVAQELQQETDRILQSSLSEKHKIDSLYDLGLRYYYRDYAWGARIGDTVLARANRNNYALGKGKAHILLALVTEGKGDLQAANKHTEAALANIPAKPQSTELAVAWFNRGNYLRRKKRDKEATDAIFKSLRIAEAIDNKRMQASCYNFLGIMNVGREQYDKALDYYQKTLDIALAIGDKGRAQRTYTNKGIVYMRQGKYKESIRSHEEALRLIIELKDERDEAFVYNDLGSVYMESGYDIPKAINYLKKSIEIRERLNEKSEISYTYNFLGRAYKKTGNEQEAIKWLKKSLAVAQEIDNPKQYYEALDELSFAYEYFHRYESAYRYLRQYNVFRDSVRKVEQVDAIAELTLQYEAEKKEQKIKLLTQKNEIQQLDLRQRNLYLIIAGLFVIGAVATLWLTYRNKKIKEQQLKKEAEMQAELLHLEAQNALQNDRVRISRDLHDNIGSYLTYLNTTIDSMSQDEVANTKFDTLKDLTSETINELRRTVWLINKPTVMLEEWVIKLKEYFKNIPHLAVNVQLDNPLQQLTSLKATTLFRVVQEAVTNAVKYAGADNITISIKQYQQKLELAITDNGKGFNINEVNKGFGLENMQQRMQELNGTIEILSSVGKGTTIHLVISH